MTAQTEQSRRRLTLDDREIRLRPRDWANE